jgi:hypothetical protein
MKRIMKKIFLILLSFAVFAACERKIDEFAPSANGLDFSKFVSVGNSMTAGYADGALYTSGQVNSIPNIMADQFKLVGGGNFIQPLIATEEGVGITQTSAGPYFTTKMALKVTSGKNCDGSPDGNYSLKPGLLNPAADQATLAGQLLSRPTDPGPYNNMGVPGATVQTLFYPGYGSALGNPYFARFASNPMATVIGDAAAQQPTFFYLWIGNNDVLGSALAGTDMYATPVDTFAKYYNIAVGALLASGKSPKGVLANIPDVTSIPFFNTISKSLPYNGVVLNATQAAGLNTLYGMYGHPEIVWHEGQNPFVITTTTGEWVQMQAGDQFLLTLPTDSLKCRGMGIADQTVGPIPKPYPIPGKYVLQKGEIENLTSRVNAYNQIIKAAADANNLAYVNMNSNMKYFEPGLVFDGIKLNLSFVTGGLFSTDGIHLCPRGNAIAANYFIQAINLKYSSNIPQVNIGSYSGLIFP